MLVFRGVFNTDVYSICVSNGRLRHRFSAFRSPLPICLFQAGEEVPRILHPLRKLTAGNLKMPTNGTRKTSEPNPIIFWVPCSLVFGGGFPPKSSNLRNSLKLNQISEVRSQESKKNIPTYQTQEHVLFGWRGGCFYYISEKG